MGAIAKKHACYYCGKLVVNIAEHLESMHSDQSAVRSALIYPTKSKTRALKWDQLRRLGDFEHNTEVLRSGHGNIIPVKHPGKDIPATDFLPCSFCYGFYWKKKLSRHCKTCPFRPAGYTLRDSLTRSEILLHPFVYSEDVGNLKPVIDKMRKTDVREAILKDKLILMFGNHLYSKSGGNHKAYIAQRLRELGQLVRTAERYLDRKIYMIDLLDARKFNNLVFYTKRLAYKSSNSLQVKSIGLKLGHSIRKIAMLAKSMAIKNADQEGKDRIENFRTVFQTEWSDLISSECLRELNNDRLFNTPGQPETEDIKLFSNFLDLKLEACVKTLREEKNLHNYQQLNYVTLCKAITFNKRRGGETSRLKMINYESKPLWGAHTNKDIFESLDEFEKKLVQNLDMLKMVGKRNRHVPLILTPPLKEAMQLLYESRHEVGILKENPYFFANCRTGYICHSTIMKKFAKSSGAKKPDLITSTNLRKYCATVSQLLALNNEELEWLANHLGHDITVHRNYYRLREDSLELGKVSRILYAADQGEVHCNAGKSLSQVQFSDRDLVPKNSEDQDFNMESDSDVDANSNNITNQASQMDIEKNLVNGSDSVARPIYKESKKRRPVFTDHSDSSEEENSVPKKKKKANSKRESINQRNPWNIEVKSKILQEFSNNIMIKKAPSKAQCLEYLQRENIIDRKWTDIKNLIKNTYYKNI